MNDKLEQEVLDYTEAVLARVREGSELEKQYENELLEATALTSRLLAENVELKMKLHYLEGLIVVVEAE